MINTIDAVSRAAYQSIYVIDYFKKNFLYVSNNPLFLCGNTAEEVKNMGYRYYLKNVPKEEHPLLKEINEAGFSFFDKIAVNERIHYTISYDFHIMKGKRKTLISHKITPLLLTEEGRVWLAICVVSLSSHKKSGNIEMRKARQTVFWKYSLADHQWSENAEYGLKNTEKEILILSAQGFLTDEIADKLCLTTDTIKYHKSKLFKKLDVKNIVEALSFASNHSLI